MHDSFDRIKHYIPSLLKIFTPGKTQKERIIAAYDNKLSRIQKCLDQEAVYEAKETLFDLLWDAEKDEDAGLKLKFIERTIKSLDQLTPLNLKSGVGNICYKMITAVNDNSSSYFNYLSELATLNQFIQDRQITLMSLETLLPNGKSIDFKIQKKARQYLVEVYTILIDPSKIASDNDFLCFIEARLRDKLSNKLDSIENLPEFILVPVLWNTEGGSIAKYSHLANKIPESYKFISPFMIYGKFNSPSTGKSCYEFMSLAKYAAMNSRR